VKAQSIFTHLSQASTSLQVVVLDEIDLPLELMTAELSN
jgi:hypothetical protein